MGNSTTCSKTANVYVDKDQPSCSFSGESTNWTNSNRTITATCNDSGSGCTSGTASKQWSYTSGTTKTAGLSYKITDNVGNSTTCSKTADVYVDKTKPTVSYNKNEGTYDVDTEVTVTGNDDNFSNLWVHVYKDGTFVKEKSIGSSENNTFKVKMDSSGTWDIYAIVYDKAGNRQEEHVNDDGWVKRTYTIKTQNPRTQYCSGTGYYGNKIVKTDQTMCENIYQKGLVIGTPGAGHPRVISYVIDMKDENLNNYLVSDKNLYLTLSYSQYIYLDQAHDYAHITVAITDINGDLKKYQEIDKYSNYNNIYTDIGNLYKENGNLQDTFNNYHDFTVSLQDINATAGYKIYISLYTGSETYYNLGISKLKIGSTSIIGS